jgi:hypothetical protein
MTNLRASDYTSILHEIEKLHGQFPDDITLASVRDPQDFLIRIQKGDETDHAKLADITLGRLAVYELSSILSDDLSKSLCSIADDLKRLLRRDRKHLDH